MFGILQLVNWGLVLYSLTRIAGAWGDVSSRIALGAMGA